MVNDINHKNIIRSNGLDTDSFGSLISFMENNEEPWGVKDCESRFMYANKATLKFSQLPTNFNIEG
ncbi:hypothetical protein WFP14_04450 [Yersinia proxima]|uniref:LuxR family transcriptional regulator n=2 Tax=Yersinia proxima TaxID=2890316 RepID=A0ABW9EUW3_9GAMM